MIRKSITTFFAIIGISVATLAISVPFPVGACTGVDCAIDGANVAKTGSNRSDSLGEVFGIISKVLLFIVGAVSVVMIILGGLRYTTSNGDSQNIQSAKNTILYAVIGLVVAILGYAIVEYVISALA